MAERASRTSSSLNGLMIAVTNFIFRPSKGDASLAKRDRQESERLLHESSSSRSADVFSGEGVDRAVGVGIGPVAAKGPAACDGVGHAGLPVGVIEDAVVDAVVTA